MEAFTFALLAATGVQATSLIKYLSVGQIREFVTGIVPWLGMFIILLVGSQADVTNQLEVPGTGEVLGSLNWASLLLLSISLGSTGSVVYGFKKAIDGTDSASEPALGGGPPHNPTT